MSRFRDYPEGVGQAAQPQKNVDYPLDRCRLHATIDLLIININHRSMT